MNTGAASLPERYARMFLSIMVSPQRFQQSIVFYIVFLGLGVAAHTIALTRFLPEYESDSYQIRSGFGLQMHVPRK